MAYPISEFQAEIGGIASSTDSIMLRRMSRDHYAISPMLRRSLEGKVADIVVTPKSREELLRVVGAAVRHRIPMTPRGGGTANYGQSVPLRGGILLDMTKYTGVTKVAPGMVRARAGTMMSEIDDAALATGWELRIYPTTKTTATVGGFIAGGTGGVGSVTWGVLRDRGSIQAVEVISAEAEPRVVELRGRDAALVHHAYGANCIISEVELPTMPAWEWSEVIVAFPAYLDAVRFGIAISNTDAIVKKLVSCHEWPTPSLIQPLAGIVPPGHSMVSCYIARSSRQDFDEIVAESPGKIVADAAEGKGAYGIPLYQMAYGHALFQVQKSDPRRTAVEGFFHGEDLMGLIERVHGKVDGAGPMRMELRRWGGKLVGSGSPYVVFESEEQIARIVRLMQAEGCSVANPHTSTVRSVGKRDISPRDAAFKREMDPHNLLNPGRFELDDAADESSGAQLPTDSWTARRSAG